MVLVVLGSAPVGGQLRTHGAGARVVGFKRPRHGVAAVNTVDVRPEIGGCWIHQARFWEALGYVRLLRIADRERYR